MAPNTPKMAPEPPKIDPKTNGGICMTLEFILQYAFYPFLALTIPFYPFENLRHSANSSKACKIDCQRQNQ